MATAIANVYRFMSPLRFRDYRQDERGNALADTNGPGAAKSEEHQRTGEVERSDDQRAVKDRA
jgi:hypothetical protein